MSNKHNQQSIKGKAQLPLADQMASVAQELQAKGQTLPPGPVAEENQKTYHHEEDPAAARKWDPAVASRGYLVNLARTYPNGLPAKEKEIFEEFMLNLGIYAEDPSNLVKMLQTNRRSGGVSRLMHANWLQLEEDENGFLGITPKNKAHAADPYAVHIGRVDVRHNDDASVLELTYTFQYGTHKKAPHVYSTEKLLYTESDPDTIAELGEDYKDFSFPFGVAMTTAFFHALAPVVARNYVFNKGIARFCENSKFSLQRDNDSCPSEFSNLPEGTLISFDPVSRVTMFEDPQVMGAPEEKHLIIPFWKTAIAFVRQDDGRFERQKIQAGKGRLFSLNQSMTLWLPKQVFEAFEHYGHDIPDVNVHYNETEA